ncbi:DUF3127 domain-containing protein [Bacteroidales bacterium AH-315-N07]|nr:DUF3127 domain-containing protein [Bacteroidales bacterium AH-315-N07]
MEITGKIIKILPLQTGTSQNGEWKKQEFILETPGQYPKKVCITIWGDKIDQFEIAEGDEVTASVDIESREYNERWYTDVKAWKVEKEKVGDVDTSPPEEFEAEAESLAEDNADDKDGLPF